MIYFLLMTFLSFNLWAVDMPKCFEYVTDEGLDIVQRCSHDFGDGHYYKGDWKGGFRHGNGFYVWDGKTYSGSWVDGKKDGYGKETDPAGNTYEGYFKENLQHGPGKVTLTNGKTIAGYWCNGKKVEEAFFLSQCGDVSASQLVSEDKSNSKKKIIRKGGENSPFLSAIAAVIFSFLVYLFAFGKPKKRAKDKGEQNEFSETVKQSSEQDESIILSTDQGKNLEEELKNLKDLFEKGLISKEIYEARQIDLLKEEE